ncbi:MAG TPA: hypothetical protein VFY07_05080 [Geomobilimonas sp.]|nr:hypothetical protein [Geomobilimonas sp.]
MNAVLADLPALLLFGVVFLAIVYGGERIRRTIPSEPEYSRKFVHFSGGVAALFFPTFIGSPWSILLLATGFAGFLLLTRHMGGLRSVHGIQRHSHGALYFPVAILILFLLARQHQAFYVISILALTVSDTMAALVGGWYGAIRYDVEGNAKSLEGSLAFFFVTYLCVNIPLLLMTETGKGETILTAFVIALLVTGFEAVSLSGSDNIFIPLGTYFILEKMSRYDLATVVQHTVVLLLLIVVTAILSVRQKIFGTSGLIGMVLVNYAGWSLCGLDWLVPLLLSQVMLYILVASFRQHVATGITGYQIRVLFYSAIVPVIFIFAASAIRDDRILYLPYLTAIAGQMAIIFHYIVSILVTSTGFIGGVRRNRPVSGIFCGVIATLAIAAIPVLAGPPGHRAVQLALVLAGVLGAIGLFQMLSSRFLGSDDNWLIRQRIRCMAAGIAACLVLGVQLLLFGG